MREALEPDLMNGDGDLRDRFLRRAFQMGATDLHIQAGLPLVALVNGQIVPLEFGPYSVDDSDDLVLKLLKGPGQNRLRTHGQVLASDGLAGMGRYRISAYRQRGALSARLRLHRDGLLTSDLRLPAAALRMLNRSAALVLVCGQPASGVTTTMAALVDHINVHRRCRILQLEEPIEVLHPHKMSAVTQREVGRDAPNWKIALTQARTMSTEVVVISELRGSARLQAAVDLARGGALVLAGMRARDTVHALQEIHGLAAGRPELWPSFLPLLNGLLCRSLTISVNGGAIPATEVLVGTPAFQDILRDGKWLQLYNLMRTGAQTGHQTMEQSLYQLVKDGLVSRQAALECTVYPEDLHRMLEPR